MKAISKAAAQLTTGRGSAGSELASRSVRLFKKSGGFLSSRSARARFATCRGWSDDQLASRSARLKSEKGAYLIEFLGGLTITFLMMVLVVQLLVVLITAVMFNNALQTAGQEASVQGGLTPQVQRSWASSLPNNISQEATLTQQSVTPIVVRGRRGRESTTFGEVIQINSTYSMPAEIFTAFGLPGTVDFNRDVYVPSQSAKEN